ncbi:efflux transporter outer membrane subunit [Sphingomonas sp. TF3]|uniref:efflux transporter outer membrane subunit n=1 Tax=Sphingomonas sp. TF3 TaxID=2495580 RepID=UPI000F86EDA4|nr:efflux transporter outer membrane subunit [Sphingomonas sp. TF3]RUN78218.1 efflux transporter outer membrane subunit [Sphingomonas sp. TF3]
MIRKTIPLIALTSLAACSMAPKYVRPDLPVPPSWPVGDAYLKQSEAALPSVSYRDIFRDPRLQKIVEQALVNNRDLRIAAANIATARAQYRIQRAALLPEVDGGLSFSHRDNGTSGVSSGSTGGSTSGGTTTGGSGVRDTYSASLGITAFEIDLFGRVRSLTTAAQNSYFATESAARATRLTLVGDIASAWLNYASDQSLLKIARDTADNAQRSVTLTKARLDGGVAPRTDLDQAQIVQQTALSDLATQTTAVAQDINALQLLVGAPVDPTLLPASIDEAAPTIAELPAGLDSGILLRRPDVVQAEYTLRAANAQIGAARAALFPRISLTALAGLASTSLSSLFTGGAFNYSVAPSASYPIFRAGAGRAGVAQSQAQRDAALASYEKSIQTAFSEVANALARRGTIGNQLAAQEALTKSAGDNYRLSEARYRGGIDTFLQSLVAQRSLYSAQRTLVTTQLTGATNLVTLYRALGGDAALDVTPAGPQPVTPRP